MSKKDEKAPDEGVDKVLFSTSQLPKRVADIDINTLKTVNYKVQDQITRLVFAIVQNQERIDILTEKTQNLEKAMLKLPEIEQERQLPLATKVGMFFGKYFGSKDAKTKETPEENKA